MDKNRELIDTSFQQYFIDYEKKYFGFEGDEDKECKDKQKRYEPLFVKSYLNTGIKIENMIKEVPKYITFYIENCISFRMAFNFIIAYDEGKYIPYSRTARSYETDDVLQEILESGKVKSMDYGIENNHVIFGRVVTILNEIRKKVDTRYDESDIDFIEDFFVNVYQKKIKNILLTLANTHFQEAVVIKEGNSFSILYNDMQSFINENPNFDLFKETSYVDLMLFTKISPRLKFFKEAPKNLEYNELYEIDIFQRKAMNYRKNIIDTTIENMSIEDSVKDGELEGDKYLDILEKNKNLFYFDNLFEEEMNLLSLKEEFFTSENVVILLEEVNLLNEFYNRYKAILDEMEIETNFMKYLVTHFIVLETFVKNVRKYYSDINNEIERREMQKVKE